MGIPIRATVIQSDTSNESIAGTDRGGHKIYAGYDVAITDNNGKEIVDGTAVKDDRCEAGKVGVLVPGGQEALCVDPKNVKDKDGYCTATGDGDYVEVKDHGKSYGKGTLLPKNTKNSYASKLCGNDPAVYFRRPLSDGKNLTCVKEGNTAPQQTHHWWMRKSGS